MKQMLWILTVAMFAFAAVDAYAQQQCVCTGICKLSAGPWPAGPDQPTSCTVYKGGVPVATAPMVHADVFVNGTTLCSPADPPRALTPASSVYCEVPVPGQPLGPVALTITATVAGCTTVPLCEGVATPFSFTNVAALGVRPGAPPNVHFN